MGAIWLYASTFIVSFQPSSEVTTSVSYLGSGSCSELAILRMVTLTIGSSAELTVTGLFATVHNSPGDKQEPCKKMWLIPVLELHLVLGAAEDYTLRWLFRKKSC